MMIRFCAKMHSIALFIISLLSSIAIMHFAVPIHANLKNRNLLELHKCPACYGVNVCPQILTGEIKLQSWSRYTPWQHLNSKNVFFGIYNGKSVVLKKLGHNEELDELDNQILLKSGIGRSTRVDLAIRLLLQKHLQMDSKTGEYSVNGVSDKQHLIIPESYVTHMKNSSSYIFKGSDLIICPSQRKLRFVEDKVFETNRGQNHITILYNFLTMLMFNSEPLIFQAFPAEKGWPFPVYYGACGRLVVEEYVGLSLREWMPTANWKERVEVAMQLLTIARQLTTGTEGLRLYVTDMSVDNVAVDVQGVVKIIDAENILLVDLEKMKKDKAENYDVPYVSDNGGCSEFTSDTRCISYSEIDICTRLDSDHNYFAICREFFNPNDTTGLLSTIPTHVLGKYPDLLRYVRECFEPQKGENRVNMALKLLFTLKQVLDTEGIE